MSDSATNPTLCRRPSPSFYHNKLKAVCGWVVRVRLRRRQFYTVVDTHRWAAAWRPCLLAGSSCLIVLIVLKMNKKGERGQTVSLAVQNWDTTAPFLAILTEERLRSCRSLHFWKLIEQLVRIKFGRKPLFKVTRKRLPMFFFLSHKAGNDVSWLALRGSIRIELIVLMPLRTF